MRYLLFGIIWLYCCQLGYAQITPFTPGTIGVPQTICYNTAPAALTQLTPPSGGTGSYTYRWQKSSNNTNWSNISGASGTSYAPPVLRANTYYRLRVTSGSFGTISTNSVLITVYANLTPGSIGSAQSICYNSAPSPLTELTAPTGGTGTYTYQWQRSPDNTAWTNITGATLTGYTPPALSASTYYRRRVTSGSCGTVRSASVLITVSPQVTQAQLHDDAQIESGTSTTFNVVVTGGTAPYTVNYTRNGSVQAALTGYVSGSPVSTGVLTTGVYIYALTSVTDAGGCVATNLGTPYHGHGLG